MSLFVEIILLLIEIYMFDEMIILYCNYPMCWKGWLWPLGKFLLKRKCYTREDEFHARTLPH